MVRVREPKRVSEKKNLQAVEENFTNNVDAPQSFDDLTLDQLAQRFEEIEHQAQLYQGQILLAARKKFPSDKEFGQWCSQSLCLGSQPQRTRLMNLARFFDVTIRPLEKISVTAAYLISSPAVIDAGIAEEIYELARGNNLPVEEVKKQIQQRMPKVKPTDEKIPLIGTVIESLPIETSQPKNATNSIEKSKVEIIMTEILADMTKEEKSAILRECLRDINLYPSKVKLK